MTVPAPHLDDLRAQRWLDGQLPPAEREEADRHLAGCADCRLLVDSYRALGAALDALEAPAAPAGFAEAVLRRVEARERAVARERRLAVGILAAVAAAAAVVAALLAPAGWAPAFARAADGLGAAVTWTRIGADVAGPVVRALRLEIAAATAVAALPLLALLRRLSPRGAEASA